MRFLIFQIIANFLINQLAKYFYTKHLALLLHFKNKIIFTTFLPVFNVDEVCNISNKNQPPSNLAKYQYFKSAKDLKNYFMNISIYIALVPLWHHSNKEKIHKDPKNGIMRALEITNQNNL